MTYRFKFEVVRDNWYFLLSGIGVTLLVTLAALTIAMIVGLVVGLGRLSKRRLVSHPALAYVEVFRNTPALVPLVWMYYCLPILTGINMSAGA